MTDANPGSTSNQIEQSEKSDNEDFFDKLEEFIIKQKAEIAKWKSITLKYAAIYGVPNSVDENGSTSFSEDDRAEIINALRDEQRAVTGAVTEAVGRGPSN
ncbi:hypothetical protein B9Z55_023398 [Caenorhabditis nigoni]|uniref:Uncharacterized protein n=1 Tax=Caenorhabditis nigoni TaxID=1611254 RepID=A0A2G5SQ85_9PELO|nr:hypothetical protein B9Z55_023398 [Caenorhabditis nigoni]